MLHACYMHVTLFTEKDKVRVFSDTRQVRIHDPDVTNVKRVYRQVCGHI